MGNTIRGSAAQIPTSEDRRALDPDRGPCGAGLGSAAAGGRGVDRGPHDSSLRPPDPLRRHRAVGPEAARRGVVLSRIHVEVADHERELALAGSHHFSDYALIFRLDDLGGDGTRLRAETRAAFPGPLGQIYKTAVIRTRGHVLVVNRMLSATKRRAERG
jgi:hypothetical protein